ncbi:hypothetical protein BD780_002042 [Clostridium tetanomorphum]|uniref:Uncharacterized protein n=1 Tax=Clostridium tetanomorphum TaxID=1553 RepID=A0A923E9N7_CLOTT|nr:hypothetical protein [Clostridium tetanomorphum]MBC2399182.1 hypothetical protein [Clostridium tetanomorphum]MBP1865416.1 hypothetical protein [Clostridium tetanomorphum]NRS84817.1 hypothetical protein [Clostridium tetanomorphum]NRZ98034.1 hypothetical protein [Clostridium tetanomorphum]SQB91678.1 Uncharacterised protein [Clostridium tetanomorphum]
MKSNESKNNSKISSVDSKNKTEKKDTKLNIPLLSNQFCMKMFDYMIF